MLISQIAEHTQIPRKFLEAILLELKKGGVLTSKMGKGGGYSLLKKPEDVPLGEVIRKFNGPIALIPCASLNYYEPCSQCPDEEACGLHAVMVEVRDKALAVLMTKSLADILSR